MLFDRVFVTVGTTEFADLISTVDSRAFVDLIADRGCSVLVLQVGRGLAPVRLADLCAARGVHLEWYRFKDDIGPDLAAASLVVSHAGAGTIVECLDLKKPLVVCVNSSLQNNHQTELADQMASDGFLVAAHPETLLATLSTDFHHSLRAYPDPDFTLFPKLVHAMIQGGSR